MTGQQLRDRLEERIRAYERRTAHNHRELEHPDEREDPSLPTQIIESEIERDLRRIDTLTLIRDHLVYDEIYRLGEYDLEFGELLPREETEFFCPCCEHCAQVT